MIYSSSVFIAMNMWHGDVGIWGWVNHKPSPKHMHFYRRYEKTIPRYSQSWLVNMRLLYKKHIIYTEILGFPKFPHLVLCSHCFLGALATRHENLKRMNSVSRKDLTSGRVTSDNLGGFLQRGYPNSWMVYNGTS